MRPLTAALKRSILARLREGYILMSDFDGTLAPLVANPTQARISPAARRALKVCAQHFPVVIVSGRGLSDLRTRVNISGIWYAGNQGLEGNYGTSKGRVHLSQKTRRALHRAYGMLMRLARQYSGMVVENKRFSLSVHFRGVRAGRIPSLRHDVRANVRQFAGALICREGQEYVFNVRPKGAFNKGGAVRAIRAQLPRTLTPIFIGDDETDEEAFRVLKKGITIRVVKQKGSSARYYVRERDEVDRFLTSLSSLRR